MACGVNVLRPKYLYVGGSEDRKGPSFSFRWGLPSPTGALFIGWIGWME